MVHFGLAVGLALAGLAVVSGDKLYDGQPIVPLASAFGGLGPLDRCMGSNYPDGSPAADATTYTVCADEDFVRTSTYAPCLYFSRIKATVAEANAVCISKGAKLAEPKSDNDIIELNDFGRSCFRGQCFWIGLFRSDMATTDWQFISDDSAVTATRWGTEAPTACAGGCVAAYSDWAAEECTNEFHFICEADN